MVTICAMKELSFPRHLRVYDDDRVRPDIDIAITGLCGVGSRRQITEARIHTSKISGSNAIDMLLGYMN